MQIHSKNKLKDGLQSNAIIFCLKVHIRSTVDRFEKENPFTRRKEHGSLPALLPLRKTNNQTPCLQYRIYSIKPRGAYLIFVLFGAGLIRGQGLFEARAFALQMRWQVLSCNDNLF